MIYELENITYRYRGGDRNVFEDVSLNIGDGDILSILGPNGAGKSTLLNCMAALLKPQSGAVRLCGKDIFTMKPKEIASLVSVVPQFHFPTFGYSVLDFVVMGRASKIRMYERPKKCDYDEAEKALNEVGLVTDYGRPYTQLSGGERQQATIARAIVGHPLIILFDEPTAHLDYGNQIKTLRIIKKLSDNGYCAVVTTHNPDHAILLGGNTAVLGNEGKILTGKTDETVTEQKLKSIYRTELYIRHNEEVGRNICIYPKL